METLTSIIAIILLAWGILEIILFFKIWKMTSNVEQMLQILKDRTPLPTFHPGEQVEAKDMLGIWTVVSITEDGKVSCKRGNGSKDFNPEDLHKI